MLIRHGFKMSPFLEMATSERFWSWVNPNFRSETTMIRCAIAALELFCSTVTRTTIVIEAAFWILDIWICRRSCNQKVVMMVWLLTLFNVFSCWDQNVSRKHVKIMLSVVLCLNFLKFYWKTLAWWCCVIMDANVQVSCYIQWKVKVEGRSNKISA